MLTKQYKYIIEFYRYSVITAMPGLQKTAKYSAEQSDVLAKLLDILNYNQDLTFLLSDLDENQELQEKILALGEDIRKYYPASSCIGVNGRDCKRQYLSIIRFILKHHGKELYSNDHTLKLSEKQYRKTKKYKIII